MPAGTHHLNSFSSQVALMRGKGFVGDPWKTHRFPAGKNAGKASNHWVLESTAVRRPCAERTCRVPLVKIPSKLPEGMDPIIYSAKFPKCVFSIEALRSRTLPTGFIIDFLPTYIGSPSGLNDYQNRTRDSSGWSAQWTQWAATKLSAAKACAYSRIAAP